MPHYITDKCIGCTICAKKCPVDCIAGENKHLHVIDPEICVDCGVCESYCPVDAIANDLGELLPTIPKKIRPIAVIEEDMCSGCEFCVAACPFDCLDMNWDNSTDYREQNGPDWFPVAEMVAAQECVGCRLCEEVCIKSAIVVRWPDGTPAPTFHRYGQYAVAK